MWDYLFAPTDNLLTTIGLLSLPLFLIGLAQFLYHNLILPRILKPFSGFELPAPDGTIWIPIIGDLIFAVTHRDIAYMDVAVADLNNQYRKSGLSPDEFFAKFPGVLLHLANQKLAIVLGPQDIKYITQSNFKNYVVGDLRQEVVKAFIGTGIFTSDDQFWKDQRNLAKPSFHNLRLEQMLPVFQKHGFAVLEHIQNAVEKNQSLDVQNLFMCFTLDSSGEILFNHPVGSLHGDIPFQRAFDYLQLETEKRISNPFWKWIPAPKFNKCLKICNDFVDEIVQAAHNDPHLNQRNDLLAHFMTSTDENGKPQAHDDKYLRDMLMNFLIAGRDTTAVTLTWLFYELAINPEAQEKVYQEISTLFPSSLPSNLDEVRSLKYLKDTVNETLRLHPPVPRVLRCSRNEDDVLPSGFVIKGNTNILYQPYFLHRMEALWGRDALVFDPDRWSDDRTKAIGTYEFLPFHGGPRRCLGFDMAYNETKMAALMILQKYSVKLDPSVPVVPLGAITLCAQNGVKIFFTERSKVSLETH